MSSLLTNASAMTALQTLSQTNKNLAITQNRIATGQRISEASDNAAYWSISVGMNAQNKALSAVQDSLGFGKAILDTAYTAIHEALGKAEDMIAKYVSLEQDGIDSVAVNAEITQLKAQILAIAVGADFEGQNLLSTAGTAVDVVSGYNKTTGVTTMQIAKYDLQAAIGGTITNETEAQALFTAMKTAAANFGAMKMRIESQATFVSQQIDAIDRGVGQLVDADMEAESARLSALQVQQQLGIQALSIANSNTQNLLALFRN
ncbi:MAG: flagellin [Aquamicrobium sp.]|uniref:flagellin N-terminal helical domain-containing protein n=1 Tax=Aquamicrobium sp. TaxID=1872579 RepID=UPI00349E8CCE|nr:flagellin [Aquamicrobium sp.]MCO5157670.1 flagellin [Aquamicrobium sp.]